MFFMDLYIDLGCRYYYYIDVATAGTQRLDYSSSDHYTWSLTRRHGHTVRGP